MLPFKVGDQVVCISDEWYNIYTGTYIPGPVKGCVYTIKDMYRCGTAVGLILYEVDAPEPPPDVSPGQWGWYAEFFRPVKKTDIGVFRSMLAPTKR